MEKNNNPQLELFAQGKDNITLRNKNRGFLDNILGYEKAIMTIIAVSVLCIISFSLGVEKGKRSALARNNTQLDLAKTTQPVPPKLAPQKLTKPVLPAANNVAQQPAVMEYIRTYTIQLASYKTKSLAQKEAQSLKNNGLTPLVLAKGDYTIVCVGNFSNKEAAQPLLSQLKKRYQSCYIRRL
ncbi:MAG TPA: SPOR domain-containing protein [Candidatus Margulisiibacteriota bacterium]|nr:SPOR domain-containing protein [Candidatus Margulisiibacteriota bacterium]